MRPFLESSYPEWPLLEAVRCPRYSGTILLLAMSTSWKYRTDVLTGGNSTSFRYHARSYIVLLSFMHIPNDSRLRRSSSQYSGLP